MLRTNHGRIRGRSKSLTGQTIRIIALRRTRSRSIIANTLGYPHRRWTRLQRERCGTTAIRLPIQRRVSEKIDPKGEGRSHFLLGLIYGLGGQSELEMERYRRAIELNPSDANAIAVSGVPLASVGRIDEAIERFRLAMRLNPHHPEWYWDNLGSIFYLARRYADSVASFLRCSRLTLYSRSRYAAALAQLGERERACIAVDELLKLRPDFSVNGMDYRGWSAEQAEHLRAGMRKAGLPE